MTDKPKRTRTTDKTQWVSESDVAWGPPSEYFIQPILNLIEWTRYQNGPKGIFRESRADLFKENRVITLGMPRRTGKTYICTEIALALGPDQVVIIGRNKEHIEDIILRLRKRMKELAPNCPCCGRPEPPPEPTWQRYTQHFGLDGMDGMQGKVWRGKVVIVDDASCFDGLPALIEHVIEPNRPDCVLLMG